MERALWYGWCEVIDLANVHIKANSDRMDARLSKARLRRVRKVAEISLSVVYCGWAVGRARSDAADGNWENVG